MWSCFLNLKDGCDYVWHPIGSISFGRPGNKYFDAVITVSISRVPGLRCAFRGGRHAVHWCGRCTRDPRRHRTHGAALLGRGRTASGPASAAQCARAVRPAFPGLRPKNGGQMWSGQSSAGRGRSSGRPGSGGLSRLGAGRGGCLLATWPADAGTSPPTPTTPRAATEGQLLARPRARCRGACPPPQHGGLEGAHVV